MFRVHSYLEGGRNEQVRANMRELRTLHLFSLVTQHKLRLYIKLGALPRGAPNSFFPLLSSDPGPKDASSLGDEHLTVLSLSVHCELDEVHAGSDLLPELVPAIPVCFPPPGVRVFQIKNGYAFPLGMV